MEVSARTKKLTEEYDMQPEDLMFADLVHAGWGRTEGAYFAYHLSYFDKSRITFWLKDKMRLGPGIQKFLNDMDEADTAERKKLKEEQKKLKDEQSKLAKKADRQREVTEDSLRTKQGMLDYLIELAATPGLDLKTRADIAKQITDLQQYKKEEIKEDDNRINFYLPLTCNKCALYKAYLASRPRITGGQAEITG